QFGKPLDVIYAGVPVTERNGRPINQNITQRGTYIDPVGDTIWPGDDPYVPEGSNAATQWITPRFPPKLRYPRSRTFVQNIPVEVGGPPLNPAVVNRRVTITLIPGDFTRVRLKITWP